MPGQSRPQLSHAYISPWSHAQPESAATALRDERTAPAVEGGIESNPTYTQVACRWAAIEPLSARELLIAADAQVFSEVTHRITMLYTATIGHQDRIVFKGRTFEILGEPLNTEEANREMTLLCVERK